MLPRSDGFISRLWQCWSIVWSRTETDHSASGAFYLTSPARCIWRCFHLRGTLKSTNIWRMIETYTNHQQSKHFLSFDQCVKGPHCRAPAASSKDMDSGRCLPPHLRNWVGPGALFRGPEKLWDFGDGDGDWIGISRNCHIFLGLKWWLARD